jgi:hypothetical protein
MIFFIGDVAKYSFVKKKQNISAAASEWKEKFIHNLREFSKEKSYILQYFRDRPWPLGSFYIKNKNFSRLKNSIYIDYVNLPLFRNFILKKKIISNIKKIINKENHRVITYNFSQIDINIARYLKFYFSFKWILICADFDSCKSSINEKIFKECDKVIFLSYYSFKKYKGNNKLFYPGTVQISKPSKTRKIKNFLYSGSLESWTGVNKFLNDFCKLKNNSIKLYITSDRKTDELDTFLKNDKRIVFVGFLPNQDYNLLIKKIDCFVSLRDENNKNNLNNFPSKIIKYYSFVKPIISSHMINLPANLAGTLIMKKRQQSYADLIASTLKLSIKEIDLLKSKMTDYCKINENQSHSFYSKIANLKTF